MTVLEGRVLLPDGSEQSVAYLQQRRSGAAPSGALAYLHLKRRAGKFGHQHVAIAKIGYQAELPRYMAMYTAWATRKGIDTVVRVGSSARDADPYFDAVLEGSPGAVPMRDILNKNANYSSISVRGLAEAIAGHWIDPAADLSGCSVLALIDDMVADGDTMAASLYHLRAQGLTVGATVWLVAPVVLHDLVAPS